MGKQKRMKKKVKYDPKNKSLKDFIPEKQKQVQFIEDLAFAQLLRLGRAKR